MNRRQFLKLGLAGVIGYMGETGCYTTNTFSIDNNKQQFLGELPGKYTVMTYNIANARGNTSNLWRVFTDRKRVEHNLDMIVEKIRFSGAVLVGMQEVDFDSHRTCNIEQARYIAEKLDYNYVSEEKYFHIPGILSMGNAVVSKYPLELNCSRNFGEYFLQRVAHWFKGFLDVKVRMPSTDLDFVVTHLHTRSMDKKVEEVEMLLKHVSGKKRDFILAGDFNCSYGTQPFKLIEESGLFEVQHLRRCVPSYPSHRPKHSIDHIIPSKSFSIKEYGYLECSASDHAPIVGDVLFVN